MKEIKVVFRRLVFPYWKDYITYFILAVIGMILAAAGTSASAYLVKPVLDEIFLKKDEAALHTLPWLIILVYAMKAGGNFLQSYYTEHIGQDIIRRIRNRMMRVMLSLDLGFFQRFRSGELISRNINDVERLKNIVSTLLPVFARETLTAVGLLGVVIYQSPHLALYALVFLPAAILPIALIAKRLKRLSHKTQEKTSDLTSRLAEILNNIEIIKAHATEDFEHGRFAKENRDYYSLTMKSIRTSLMSSPVMELLGAIGIAFVIYIGGQEVIDGTMSTGAFFSFMTALFMLYSPIKRITNIINQLQNALAACERILFLLDQKPQVASEGTLELTEANQLRFENVYLSYGETEALRGVSLTVNRGEKLALIGPSGGGKSSLVNLVVRFFDPQKGEILIDGHSLKEYALPSLRKGISIVTQRVYIFHDSVAANVAYGNPIDPERVAQVLKMANAWEFVQVMGGIDTLLEEHGTNLSGGQRQRIAIARALYNDPKIIIFDEATSALDNESERLITQAIDKISQDRITLIIAHRLSTVKRADKIAVLEKGQVVCLDTIEALEETCPAYQRLAGAMEAE
ncbi:ABC transporter ATP-binding protein [Nitratifractor salsuginis]|uniref:ABC transporter related protein n=1 Tax=Nitratifractor salsuginis (strain DSM 16511 / JCM 12458 / E9I37-1) TaxID=749222 RepID=E6X1I1_NITSE|nr:ABC transporter transmembrane domain-containing protein [Nitratifractor salsuginis]ADV45914.1 ABC transporter related protein [Nitratifractor salsuginis DSM 16511]